MSRIVEGCVVRERCQVQLMDRQRELQIGRHFANCHFCEDTSAPSIDNEFSHIGGKTACCPKAELAHHHRPRLSVRRSDLAGGRGSQEHRLMKHYFRIHSKYNILVYHLTHRLPWRYTMNLLLADKVGIQFQNQIRLDVGSYWNR